jgi:hypothetical protein
MVLWVVNGLVLLIDTDLPVIFPEQFVLGSESGRDLIWLNTYNQWPLEIYKCPPLSLCQMCFEHRCLLVLSD